MEAIQENEIVIERMKERILLLKAEVEKRGVSWREFAGAEEMVDDEGETIKINGTRNDTHANTNGDIEVNGTGPAPNGTPGTTPERHSAWTDGTFQVGRISGGEVVMEQDGAGSGVASSSSRGQGQHGGRLGDEELRRMMEERMRAAMEADEDEGMHL